MSIWHPMKIKGSNPRRRRMNNEKRFYMVYVDGQGSPTYKHATQQAAESEAERLALMPSNQGRYVYVLESVACCIKRSVDWVYSYINHPDLPF